MYKNSLNSKQIYIQTHRLEYDIHNSGVFFFLISITPHYRITIIKELSTFAFSNSCHKLYTWKAGKIGVDMFKLCSYSLINIQIPQKESKNVSMHSIYTFIYDIINDHSVTCASTVDFTLTSGQFTDHNQRVKKQY